MSLQRIAKKRINEVMYGLQRYLYSEYTTLIKDNPLIVVEHNRRWGKLEEHRIKLCEYILQPTDNPVLKEAWEGYLAKYNGLDLVGAIPKDEYDEELPF